MPSSRYRSLMAVSSIRVHFVFHHDEARLATKYRAERLHAVLARQVFLALGVHERRRPAGELL